MMMKFQYTPYATFVHAIITKNTVISVLVAVGIDALVAVVPASVVPVSVEFVTDSVDESVVDSVTEVGAAVEVSPSVVYGTIVVDGVHFPHVKGQYCDMIDAYVGFVHRPTISG